MILITILLAIDPLCGDPLLDRALSNTPSRVLVVLEADPSRQSPSTPIINRSDVNRLTVTARVVSVKIGRSPVPPGQRFSLAVHSVASAFGGDYIGEQYVLGMNEAGTEVRTIAPLPESVVRIRCVVRGPSPKGSDFIPVTWNGNQKVRIHILAGQGGAPEFGVGKDVDIAVQPERELKAGEQFCLLLIRRIPGSKREFRLLRSYGPLSG